MTPPVAEPLGVKRNDVGHLPLGRHPETLRLICIKHVLNNDESISVKVLCSTLNFMRFKDLKSVESIVLQELFAQLNNRGIVGRDAYPTKWVGGR